MTAVVFVLTLLVGFTLGALAAFVVGWIIEERNAQRDQTIEKAVAWLRDDNPDLRESTIRRMITPTPNE